VHNTLGISLRSCCAEPNKIDEYNKTKAADEAARGIGELHVSQQASDSSDQSGSGKRRLARTSTKSALKVPPAAAVLGSSGVSCLQADKGHRVTFQAPRAPEPMCEVAPDRFLVSVKVACRNHRQREWWCSC
jgi:hypothetical protein